MTVKIDEPTGVNWNDTAANERERVGVVHIHVRQTPGLQKTGRGLFFLQPLGNPYGFMS